MNGEFSGAIHALDIDGDPGSLMVRLLSDGRIGVTASADLAGDAEITLGLGELRAFITLLEEMLARSLADDSIGRAESAELDPRFFRER